MDASTIFLACLLIIGIVAFVEGVRRVLEKIAEEWLEDEDEPNGVAKDNDKNDESND